MGTLVDFRAWLRLDLNDPAGATQRFADGDLDRAVTRAVAELTRVQPYETDSEYTVTAASLALSLAGAPYAGALIGVSEVEQPYGAAGALATNPPTLVPFRLSADRTLLRLLGSSVPAVGDVLRIRWSQAHAVAAGSTTVPAELDALLALGALGHACLAYSTPASDNFRYEDGEVVGAVDDSAVPREWRTRGSAYLAEFRSELAALAKRLAVVGRPWVPWAQPAGVVVWPTANLEGLREP